MGGLAAFALPGAALAVCGAPGVDELGLIEAARLYAEILPIERAQSEKTNACSSEALAMCRPFVGSDYDAAMDRAQHITGWKVEDDKLMAIWKRMETIELMALASQPQTFAGLRLYALMAAHYGRRLWDEPLDDLDYDKQIVRRLIEVVMVLTKEARS
jgi:predicted DNA-binding protein (MmcQ/YjbR family)